MLLYYLPHLSSSLPEWLIEAVHSASALYIFMTGII